MAFARKETSYERRIKDLQKEADAIGNDIRTLSKSVKKLDVSPNPPPPPSIKPAREPVPPVAAAESGIMTSRVTRPFSTDQKDPIVETPKRRSAFEQLDEEGWDVGEAGDFAPPRKKPTAADPERFASYFSSGSFGKSRPLSQERKLQRNKAIIMVLFVLIVAFLLYRAIF